MLGKMRKVLNNGKGFSLVELIVVIAILGILAGIAAPNVIRYIDSSRVKADVSTAAIIGNAVLAGIAEEKIVKEDYVGKELSFTVPKTALSGSTDIIGAVIEKAVQPGTILAPKLDTATQFVVAIADNGAVTVSIGDTELFPVADSNYGE